jgi:septal ring-binding cell division protein DamX
MGVNNDAQLTAHLQTLAKVLEPSKIYVFRTVAQGKPSVTVIYGSYADRKAALEALQKLPPAIVANRPVLRTVKGIRAEMVQNRTDS